MKTWKKIIRLIKYHIGPKELEYDNELNKYLPKNILDTDCLIYVTGKKQVNGLDYYTVLISDFNGSQV